MSGARKFDTGGRWARFIQAVFIIGIVLAVIYFIVTRATTIFEKSAAVQCKLNMQAIAKALQDYEDQYNQFPKYLTELYPSYIDDKRVFICAADELQGEDGCIPKWMSEREMTGGKPFKDRNNFVDLDGKSMTRKDEDSILCSYLYEYNQYPCFWSDPPFKYKWYDMKKVQEHHVKQCGLSPENVVPVVRCLHHLKPGAKRDEGPTFNILLNLDTTIKETNWDWRTDHAEILLKKDR